MNLAGPLIKYIASLTPAQVCQGVYILSSATILAINVLPEELRTMLVEYGARHQNRKDGKKQKGTLQGLVGLLEVPHSWFLHFYVVSVACSAFWAWQYLTHGAIMGWLAREQVRDGQASVELSRVFVVWGLMTLQGLRRLYESLFVTKSGSSPMSSLHWIAGVLFYTGMSISIWIEGSGAILHSWETAELPRRLPSGVPTAVGLFVAGWIKQNQCHRHLASLKKYTLPDQGWFRQIVCPHYTSECLIYLSLSIAAAPPGKILGRTVFTGLVFVALNLGTTAGNTKKWYAQKFGSDKVEGKWKMIPYVF